MVGLDQQKQILDNLLEDVDEFQSGREDVTAKARQQEFFNWFSDGGRVGMKTGGMDRRTFLKWIAGLAATATGLIKGKGLTTKAPIAKAVPKAIAKFQGVEGMPLWFPRAVQKIKTHGKLIEMADKHYVGGDMYEMMIPVKIPKFDRVAGKELPSGFETVEKKVIMEENPLTGEISMQWTGTDNFGDDAVRQINFKPGEAGYQKFGVDDADAAAQGVTEFQRVKVSEPEFTYSQPDQSQPYRDDIEYLDIFTEGDEMVGGLEKMTGTKQMVTKDGTVIDVSAEGKGVDEAFQKKIYKDIEGEGQIIPEPEGTGVSSKGDVYGEEQYNEILGGEIPEHLKKKASGGRVGFKHGGSWADWMSNHSDDMTFEEYLQMDMDKPIHPINKNTGGIIETGEIARRPGAVPPLSGPAPDGIMSLYSNPKQVNVA
jgi:predicted GNAT family acetyltransferase